MRTPSRKPSRRHLLIPAGMLAGGLALMLYGTYVDSQPRIYDCGRYRFDMNAETTRYDPNTLSWEFVDTRTGESESCSPYHHPDLHELRRVE